MTIDWNKLVDDLKIAKGIAEEASKGEDGGTANLDYVYIKLPRAREKRSRRYSKWPDYTLISVHGMVELIFP